MRVKHLIKLPLGNYYLTNGIYNYTFSKSINNYDGSVHSSIREMGMLTCGSIAFREREENYFDDSNRYKFKTYKFYAYISGLMVSGYDISFLFNDLRFIPRSSYKEWLKKMESYS